MSKNAEGWIRHRGGKCPVEAGTLIDIRCRDGLVRKGVPCGKYLTRTASMLWSHEGYGAEVMAYRLHKPVEQVEACSKPEFRSLPENYGEIIGGSVEGPIQWRDRITEIDATTKALTTERADLVQKLASEGFALIGRINELLTDSAQKHEDMSDWRNWKVGDFIEATDTSGGYSPGCVYEIRGFDINRAVVLTVSDDSGSKSNGWSHKFFKFHSRPSA